MRIVIIGLVYARNTNVYCISISLGMHQDEKDSFDEQSSILHMSANLLPFKKMNVLTNKHFLCRYYWIVNRDNVQRKPVR